MRPPMNMTPEETALWNQMDALGDGLVNDMTAAIEQVERLPEWMQESAVNQLCEKAFECRALACEWMNDHGEP